MNSRASPRARLVARRAGVALLIVALAGLTSLVSAAAQRPNGAGLVVRHGDGTLLYVYVQFTEDTISGEELLYRSGLDLAVAPFAGMGVAVCSLDGEGYPPDNCFGGSYFNPAYYWRYYAQVNGAWVEQARGPTSRELRDGDVDAWSWTAGDPGLPAVTIDEIAAVNGVDRNASEPTATVKATATLSEPTSTSTAEPPPSVAVATMTATATDTPPSATATQPPPTVAFTATATSVAAGVATATLPMLGAANQSPAVATRATRTVTPTSSPRPSRTPSIARVEPTATAMPTTLAVVIPPNGTPQPLRPTATTGRGGSGVSSYLLFGLMAGAAVAAGGIAMWRARRPGAR